MSTGYLAARGTPASVADLCNHTLFGYADRPTNYQDASEAEAEFPSAAAISDSVALLPAVLGDGGIARLPDFLAARSVSNGQLVRLWPTTRHEEVPINALCPSQRALSPKVRVFIDALVSAVSILKVEGPG
ncbi:LysR substrate-binding domain-containing protein [Martelella sp. FLE1502]